MLQSLLSPDFFNAILRATTPILFAALASSVASKSGITNMALEGIMLFSALFGVIFSAMTGNFAAGLLLTMAAGGAIGLRFPSETLPHLAASPCPLFLPSIPPVFLFHQLLKVCLICSLSSVLSIYSFLFPDNSTIGTFFCLKRQFSHSSLCSFMQFVKISP